MSQTYSGSQVTGAVSIDWVCLDGTTTDSCVTDFPFLNVKTPGLGDDINGVMGLCADPRGSGSDGYIGYLYT